MKLFITGASGMVARNVLEHEAANNYEIIAPDRNELDLLDFHAVSKYIKRQKPCVVLHCAGLVGGIQANMDEPVRFFFDNMQMGLNVIKASRDAGVTKLLNLGSSCMYPRNAENPLKEETVLKGDLEPTNEGYALAKISAARLCDYIRKEAPNYIYKTLIPCNLYGRYDKFGVHNAHMVPAVIAKIDQAIEDGATEVEIWGDGEARREFMYAADLADFIFMALDRLDDLPQLLNVGLGHDYTINEYYRAVADVLGYRGKFVHDLSKPVGMKQKLIDTTRVRTFGWTHKTSLRDGIRKTYQFYQDTLLRNRHR